MIMKKVNKMMVSKTRETKEMMTKEMVVKGMVSKTRETKETVTKEMVVKEMVSKIRETKERVVIKMAREIALVSEKKLHSHAHKLALTVIQ